MSPEETFDQPVFQRVKGDDAETAPGPQRVPGGAQARVELVQLVVHENAQSLEGLSGDVGAAAEAVFACVYDGGGERPWGQKKRPKSEYKTKRDL